MPVGACNSTTWNIFRVGAQTFRAIFFLKGCCDHLTCHVSRCSHSHLASNSGRHPFRIFNYSEVHGQVQAILQTTTWHWIVTFTPLLGVLIRHGSRGYVTDVNEVTPHRLTIVGKPQEESSLVHDFLLASMVILYYIGRYPVHHVGYYRMQVITLLVLELPPLSSKGI